MKWRERISLFKTALFNPRQAASRGLFASETLFWHLILACVFLNAPRFFYSVRLPVVPFYRHGILDYLPMLLQELFVAGVAFGLFALILPIKLAQYISKNKQNELWKLTDFANMTLFTLLIYLLINFPLNIFSLFADISESSYTIALIGHGIIALIFAVIWFCKALVPKYLESKTKAAWIIVGYFFVAVIVPLAIILNFDFIWELLAEPVPPT